VDRVTQTSPAHPWRIRPYRPGDERALVALWAEVFGKPMSEEHWRWKLKGRPTPVDNLGIAVSTDDRPVFQIGGIPCGFRLNGAERLAMVAVDAMTAPGFRRRGLLTEVTSDLFRRWQEAGVALVLGLPNEQWGSRTRALGWQPLFPLAWLIRPLRPEALLARRLHVPRLARLDVLARVWNGIWDHRPAGQRDVAVRELLRPGPELDLLWQAGRESFTTSLVHDRSWVEWRYFAAPGRRYRVLLAERAGAPVGYAAYRVREGGGRAFGCIAEVFAPRHDPTTVRRLVTEAVARLRIERVEGIATLAVPGTSAYRILRRAGFLFRRGAFTVECVTLDRSLAVETLGDPASWHLAGGDFDVV